MRFLVCYSSGRAAALSSFVERKKKYLSIAKGSLAIERYLLLLIFFFLKKGKIMIGLIWEFVCEEQKQS